MSLAPNLAPYPAQPQQPQRPVDRPDSREQRRSRPNRKTNRLNRQLFTVVALCWITLMGAAFLHIRTNAQIQAEEAAMTSLRGRIVEMEQRVLEREAQLVQARSFAAVAAYAQAHGMVRPEGVEPLPTDMALVAKMNPPSPEPSVAQVDKAPKGAGVLHATKEWMTRTFQLVWSAKN